MQEYVIGLDIGTTGVKAIALAANGQLLHTSSRPLQTHTVEMEGREQDPSDIAEAVFTVLSQCKIPSCSLQGIAVSTAMRSMLPVDTNNIPLSHALLWSDNRSFAQAQQLRQHPESGMLHEQTGTPIHPMSPLAKLCWLREKRPSIFEKAARFVSIKEYILFRLTGEWVVDASIASATGMLDIRTRHWHPKALTIAGVSEDQLSTVVSPYHRLLLLPEMAKKLGFATEIPIFPGGSDGCLANLGVLALRPDEMTVTVGTSGAVRVTTPQPISDPQHRLFCYVLDENWWVTGGPVNNGGIVLQWFSEQIDGQKEADYQGLLQEAEQVVAGAEGLVFLPYLQGERAPFWDAQAKGAFIGLGIHHHRQHLVRAMLEGLIFSLLHTAEAVQETVGKISVLKISGGLAQSAFWVQMLSDCFQLPVQVTSTVENSAVGAALMAWKATGKLADYEAARLWFPPSRTFEPNPALRGTYLPLFEIYKRLYPMLQGEMKALAQISKPLED